MPVDSLNPLGAGNILGLNEPTAAVKWLGLLHNLTQGYFGPGLPTLINELESNRLQHVRQSINQGFLTAYGTPGAPQMGAGGPPSGAGQELSPDALLRTQAPEAGGLASIPGPEGVPTPETPQAPTPTATAAPTAPAAAPPQAALLQALLQPTFQPPPEGVEPRAWMYGQILGRHQRLQELTESMRLMHEMSGAQAGGLTPQFMLNYEQRERLAKMRGEQSATSQEAQNARFYTALEETNRRAQENLAAITQRFADTQAGPPAGTIANKKYLDERGDPPPQDLLSNPKIHQMDLVKMGYGAYDLKTADKLDLTRQALSMIEKIGQGVDRLKATGNLQDKQSWAALAKRGQLIFRQETGNDPLNKVRGNVSDLIGIMRQLGDKGVRAQEAYKGAIELLKPGVAPYNAIKTWLQEQDQNLRAGIPSALKGGVDEKRFPGVMQMGQPDKVFGLPPDLRHGVESLDR